MCRSHRRGSVNPDTGDWVWSEEEEIEDIPEGDSEDSDDSDTPLHVASPEEKALRQKAIEMANRENTSSSDEESEHARLRDHATIERRRADRAAARQIATAAGINNSSLNKTTQESGNGKRVCLTDNDWPFLTKKAQPNNVPSICFLLLLHCTTPGFTTCCTQFSG